MSTSTRIKRVIPVALYTVFYLLCFTYLENRHVRVSLLIPVWTIRFHSANILFIPFVMVLYIAVTVGYFLFFNENTN